MLAGRPERERVEDFCGRFVESGNKMQAYRLAYAPDTTRTTQWVWDQVSKLMGDPEVAARVQEMRDEAAAAEMTSVREIIRDLVDIIQADPNELISVNLDCCRYCHGDEHQFQWINPPEFEHALGAYMERQAVMDASPKKSLVPPEPMPNDAGGYGYWPSNDPHPSCPHCFGRGVNTTMAHDSRKVSPQARKLYAGAKVGKDGQLEIKMHDQMKAREMLNRVLGVFKDGLPVVPTQAAAAPAGVGAPGGTQEEAARAYMRLIGGGK